MGSRYGRILKKIAYKSDYEWMMSEYDERLKDYWKVSGVIYFVKMIDEKGLEDEI